MDGWIDGCGRRGPGKPDREFVMTGTVFMPTLFRNDGRASERADGLGNETKRNEMKRNEMKRNETKQIKFT